MNLLHTTYTLKLINPFGIARSTKSESPVVLTSIDGGYGESAPIRFYGEDVASVENALQRLAEADLPGDLDHIEDVTDALDRIFPFDPVTRTGNQAAKTAVDLALHDRLGKKLGVPLHVLFGRAPEPDRPYYTSFTIGLDTIEEMLRKVEEAKNYAILKIKLGRDVEHDIAVMTEIRKAVGEGKTLRVDANAGWSLEDARKAVPVLADLGVEYVEQPLAKGNLEELRLLKKECPLPIYVDEDSILAADLPRLNGIVDGINIKLMKTGGLVEARRMVALARIFGFKVMIGCMIETGVAITAAAHLAPYADNLDLDGNLLISNDPFTGVKCDADGRLHLPQEPGIGVTLKPEYAEELSALRG